VKYFNGFSLKEEEAIFAAYLDESDFVVAGFSYGAQRAFEYVHASERRVEKLILISPAFFQTQKRSFIRTQLRYFESDAESYSRQFLINVAYPSQVDLSKYLHIGTKDELESLLTYEWSAEKIKELLARGTQIEVYLGGSDKIIESSVAYEFFSNLTLTYFIKDVGHCLLGSDKPRI
jgi:pimeloyl-ACP methyl ester carboxylesterase